jgi:hypothetical protein
MKGKIPTEFDDEVLQRTDDSLSKIEFGMVIGNSKEVEGIGVAE